jgi:protein ImuA
MPAGSALLDRRGTATALLGPKTGLARGAALAQRPGFKPLGKGEAEFARLLGALPRAAAHEIAPAAPGEGPAAAGFAAALAVYWGSGPIIWAREAAASAEDGELYPPGLAELGLDLTRLIVVDAKKRFDALWAAEEALKIKGAVAIAEIGPRGAPLDLTASRRLAMSAAEHDSTALIISHIRARDPSAAWTRWQIAAAPSAAPAREIGAARFSADLTRMRNAVGGRRWSLEWNAHDRQFRETLAKETMDSDLVHPPADGQADPARRRAG